MTDVDRRLFELAGYGAAALPTGRAAVLVIDMTVAFLGDRPEPLSASIERFPNSCGEYGWVVADRIGRLLAVARSVDVPVIYTVKDVEHAELAAASWKRTRQHQKSECDQMSYATVISPLAPRRGDVIIRKTKPSAFFATSLLQYLLTWKSEHLICCGATTSGCVRATAVDAFSYGFAVTVPEDGTVDRGQASHAVNLFDMAQKYAAVVPTADVIATLAGTE
ncbi:MAG: isochorismatase family protein [Thermocrispum sp.]